MKRGSAPGSSDNSGDRFDDFDDTKGRPVLITAAAPSYEEQHRARVRKYLTLMSIRVPALLLAAFAYGAWHNGLISLAIVAASIPLPWMAVLIANDRPPGPPRNLDVLTMPGGAPRCFLRQSGRHSNRDETRCRHRTRLLRRRPARLSSAGRVSENPR